MNELERRINDEPAWINKDGQTNRSLSTGEIPRRDGRWKGFCVGA
jgi:hypothetical protein